MMIAALSGGFSFKTSAQSVDTNKMGALSLGTVRAKQPIEKNRLTLSPNPANRWVDIRLDVADLNGFNLELYDAMGMRLLLHEWRGDALDVSKYPPGVYLLTLRRDKETYQQKLMIER